MSIKKDKYFLNLAINLAKNCLGYTGPNPAVGAVVVKDNQVVSFGNTHFSGRPHAEINALKKIDKKLLKNSTIYISLEPCSHYGKTPPCVNKIISSKIKRVVQKFKEDAPHEVMLILDGSTGQNAFVQAEEFTKATNVNSIAITKLDGTAKGGVVIGITDQFKIPIKYIGVGEKVGDLKLFHKGEFVNSFFD